MKIEIEFFESGEACRLRKTIDGRILKIDNPAPFATYWIVDGNNHKKLLSCPGDYAEAILEDGVVVQKSPDAPSYITKYDSNSVAEEYSRKINVGELGFVYDGHFITLVEDEYCNDILTSTDLRTGNQYFFTNGYIEELIIENNLLFRDDTFVVSLAARLNELWRFEFSEEYDFSFPNRNYAIKSLMKGRELVVFVAGYSTEENETLIIALNPNTGEKVWGKKIEGMAESFCLSNGKCYLALNGRFCILDEITGNIFVTREHEVPGNYALCPLGENLLFITAKPAAVYLYSADGAKLLQYVSINNRYAFRVNSKFLIIGDQLFITTTSQERHLALALNGYAKISLAEGSSSAIVSMQERPMTIAAAGRAKDKEYILDFSHSSKDDLIRYMQIGIREIACRYGQGDIYISPEIDKEHAGKIVVRYDPSGLDADIEGELDDIAKPLMTFIEDEICYFPGANGKNKCHWSIRFEQK